MAFSYSPKIVTDGLIFYVDAQNSRSYEPDLSKVYSLARKEPGASLVYMDNEIDLQQPPPPDPGDGIVLANDSGILSFQGDGTDEFLRSNGSPFATNIGPDCTFDVWLNYVRGDAAAAAIFCGGAGGSSARWWLYTYSDLISWRVADGVSAAAINYPDYTAASYPNDWNNLTGTISANIDGVTSTMRIYLNGELVSENTSVGIIAERATATREPELGRGGSSGSQRMAGKIANAKIYNRELSAEEVLRNYTALKTRFGL